MAKKTRKSKFTYRAPDKTKVRSHSEGRGGFDSFVKDEFLKYTPKEGLNKLRIFPPTWEDEQAYFGFPIALYWKIGVASGSYAAPVFWKKPDPVAEERQRAIRQGDEKLAKELAPKSRVLYWVIDRDDEDAGPKIFPCAVTLDRDISGLLIDPKDGEVQMIDHPNEGYDISFRKTGQGLNTKYTAIRIDNRSSPICEDEDQQEEWIEFIMKHPLPDTVDLKSYDYLKAILDGGSPVEKNGDDEDNPRPSRRGSSRRGDDDDDDRDKDTEEDEKPSARRRGGRREVEIPNDGEGDDEEPRARRRRPPRQRDDKDDGEDSDDEPPF